MNTSYSIKTKIKYKWKAIGYQYKKKKPSNLGDHIKMSQLFSSSVLIIGQIDKSVVKCSRI
jgi:hypothetical protein